MGLWPELRSLPRRDKATQFREKILYEVDLHFTIAYFKTDLTPFWQRVRLANILGIELLNLEFFCVTANGKIFYQFS